MTYLGLYKIILEEINWNNTKNKKDTGIVYTRVVAVKIEIERGFEDILFQDRVSCSPC